MLISTKHDSARDALYGSEVGNLERHSDYMILIQARLCGQPVTIPFNVWRSMQMYPTNGLCACGFARELKLALLGMAGDAPNYPEVERAFRNATGGWVT